MDEAFTYAFNMIDYINSFLVNCYQNGDILLLEQTHKTTNWLLHLAVVEGSTVCWFKYLTLFVRQRPARSSKVSEEEKKQQQQAKAI